MHHSEFCISFSKCPKQNSKIAQNYPKFRRIWVQLGILKLHEKHVRQQEFCCYGQIFAPLRILSFDLVAKITFFAQNYPKLPKIAQNCSSSMFDVANLASKKTYVFFAREKQCTTRNFYISPRSKVEKITQNYPKLPKTVTLRILTFRRRVQR